MHHLKNNRGWLMGMLLFPQGMLGSTSAEAQTRSAPFGHNFLFELYTITSRAMVTEPVYTLIPDTAVYRIYDKLEEGAERGVVKNRSKSPLLLGVKLNPSLTRFSGNNVQSVTKEYPSYRIADSSEAILIAMGITIDNKDQYRYHVVENDSVELVPWSPVAKLEQQFGARQPYAFLGRFKAPGKTILVEVVHVKDYRIRDGVLFDWRTNLQPVLAQITLGMRRDYFNLAYLQRNRHYATRFDPQTGVPLDFAFPVDSVEQIILQLERRESVAYAVYLLKEIAGRRDTVFLGMVNQAGQFALDKGMYTPAGRYEVRIESQSRMPVWDEASMIKIPFEVLPSPEAKTLAWRQIVPWLLGALVLVLLLFAAYRQYSRRLVRRAAQQRSMIQLQLKSIRSQLNPHFMFNALGSIQNLMNKNNQLLANLYLAKFAGLTRKVLNTSEQELISLEEELKIADDYLQMEQLRFGFQYELQVAANINQANTGIPSMLLQPFIENAVKHGLAALKDQGKIIVSVQQKGHDLVFVVQDNGAGFRIDEVAGKESSWGLKLSQERVDLINRVYKDQPASLQFFSEPGNTTVTLTLTNWSRP
ncbi:hypothetical protein D3H65_02185 [Paraflavitalea soli]|uniref:Uncharacterized protein n=1 Tax=Paraflavitalea soli TaxID=2315862 RepID=A0A3B7MI21_9BACT|nr:histidine kinase [Paraflavitalea soli]AXY72849.1 hypothetical protein D3H65_02185 [Paraflavitalea soli]